MTSSNGIVDLLGRKLTLEDRINAYLMRVPTDAELMNDYVDPTDRQRVRQRKQISALLDACFDHGFQDVDKYDVEIEICRESNCWSELANARRNFNHDVELLNAGSIAQLILSPTKTDTALTEKPISAKAKRLILWLAVIHLHQEGLNAAYPTQQSVIALAAKNTGLQENTFQTKLSHYKTQKNESEREYYNHFWELVGMTQQLARATGNEREAFALLLPAALAISEELPRRGP